MGGLGAVLSRKLRELGFKDIREHARKVYAFAGDQSLVSHHKSWQRNLVLTGSILSAESDRY
jgi:hypothetical protein